MSPGPTRRLRADAARNSEKIVRAAREVYAESGPDASLDDIARRAGVGIATLYRRFATKEDLVKAALEQSIAEQLQPAIDQALTDDNPLHGLGAVLRATLSLVAREHHTLAAADRSGALTAEITASYLDSLTLLTHRAQEAGLVRADVVPDDLHKIMGMLISLLWSTSSEGGGGSEGGAEAGPEGWSRYVTLVLDGLSPLGATPLPPLVPGWECRGGTRGG
ncbi:TetR/AcrR family transcriptional regulator [Streptomyces sp. NPDC057623]|uniref:TetR/AcrR family transcriptional regulator n=1 Tax=Streptomyces sp. NPDC057623 TaxID=3346187 RepID=UPI0036CC8B4B